jgi:hypothetical protein
MALPVRDRALEVALKNVVRCFAAAWISTCWVAIVPGTTHADGKISLYLTRMDPTGVDAQRFSSTSWGGGVDAVLPWYAANGLIALTSGLEIANMMSQTTHVYDPFIDEVLEQRTNQSYGRFFVGGRAGPHGPGFLRPHVGANIAAVWYGISTDIDIPNPADPSTPITKNLYSDYKAAFGYDLNAGLDLNIANAFPVEVGMRYLKSYNVPQQLGAGTVSISPAYIQFYFAIGVGFDYMSRSSHKPETPDASSENQPR